MAWCPIDFETLVQSAKNRSTQRASLEAWGQGVRWGKASGGGPGGEALEALVFLNAETAFSTQTYIHEIGKFNTFLRTIILTPSPFLMSWSPFLMVTWKVTCTLSLPTPTNTSNGHLAILNIPSTAFHIAWPSDSVEHVPLRKLYPPELPNSNTISWTEDILPRSLMNKYRRLSVFPDLKLYNIRRRSHATGFLLLSLISLPIPRLPALSTNSFPSSTHLAVVRKPYQNIRWLLSAVRTTSRI